MFYLHWAAASSHEQRPPVSTAEDDNQRALCLFISLWEDDSNGSALSFDTDTVYILVMCCLEHKGDLGGSKVYCSTSVLHIIFFFLFSLEIFFSILGCNQKKNDRILWLAD